MSTIERNSKPEDLSIDEQLKNLGARWHNDSRKRGLILMPDGPGHFYVEMVGLLTKRKADDNNEKEELTRAVTTR
ncbi:MAG TPA: hypothetical protein VF412_18590 [Bdellovibrio sp.]|uniref:hypothetical protein n=1 Tax=Bdellovibrio sp. TaxID=28201 RepID=UPI002F18C3B2